MTTIPLRVPRRGAGPKTPSHSDAKHCDLCDRSHFEPVGELDRHGRPLTTEVCTHCGLVSHGRIPSEEELAQFYAADYRREYNGEITPSPRRVMRAWKQGQRIHRQVAPWLAPGSRVFEVGAGVGCTVKVFEQHGHRAAGIEPNEGFQAYSRNRLRAAVNKGYLVDVPPDESQDLVLLIQVIEHLRSPRQSLEHLHRVIRPGGLLYVEAPNLGSFATPHRLFHFAHIHNFTPATLVAMANRCGFEVVHSFGTPVSPDLQYLLRRVENPRWNIPADSHEQTLAALRRYNFLTYHLRWEYLSHRSLDVASRGWEWVAAKGFVRKLLKQCAPSAAAA